MPIWTFIAMGVASWFSPESMYGSQPVCAMNMLPPSTHIEIVNTENHHQTDCVVIGTGPFVPGRILDVSPSVRDKLGFDGLATVRVYRVVDQIPRCTSTPSPLTCKSSAESCVLDLPKPVLVRC